MVSILNRSRTFNLRSMEAFAEIMRAGSATAAARILGVSQSAVSRLVQQLESEIGFELFYREKGRLVPTKDGLALADEIELALLGIARVNGLVEDINGNATGEVRVMAPPSFAEAVLPSVVAKFMKAFPGVRVAIDSRSIGTTKTMVATRVADCAFMRQPVDGQELRLESIVTSRTVCVIRRDHPLAMHDRLSPETIGDAPIIALGTGFVFGRQIEDAFRGRGRRPHVGVETHTTSSACALAREGVGIAIVNELLAKAHLDGELRLVPFDPPIGNSYAFVTSAQTQMGRLVKAFRATVLDHFGIGSAIPEAEED